MAIGPAGAFERHDRALDSGFCAALVRPLLGPTSWFGVAADLEHRWRCARKGSAPNALAFGLQNANFAIAMACRSGVDARLADGFWNSNRAAGTGRCQQQGLRTELKYAIFRTSTGVSRSIYLSCLLVSLTLLSQ